MIGSLIPNKKNSREVDEKEILKLVAECRKYLLEQENRLLNKIANNKADKEEVRIILEKFLVSKKINEDIIKHTLNKFEIYIFKYGELDELITDPEISDIKVLSKDNVRVKRLGKRETSNIKFDTEENFKNFANLIAVKNQVNISNINALQVVTDKSTYDGDILRINISSSYINSTDAPYIHIRKIPKTKMSLDQLQEIGMFTQEEREYIIEKIKTGCSIVFTGKGASGKTTIMNTLLDEIPFDRSGLVIQESEELFSDIHPDMMFQTVKDNKGESKVKYTLKEIAINGLLIDLDVFIISEIKGGEALYFLNASYTGHACYSSVHGNSSIAALNKLADYVKYESDYTREEILSMLSDIDVVIFMKDFSIKEISETVGFDYEKKEIIYNRVFENHKRLNKSCEKILKKISA